MMEKFDAIIIGAGPNGLLCGAYLAKAGMKVLLLEKRHEIGGGLITEEITVPNFLHDTHAIYMAMIDYAPAIKDLELDKNIKWVRPEPNMSMHFSDGRVLSIYPDYERTSKSIAQFSAKDAKTYLEIGPRFAELTEKFLAPATYKPAVPSFQAVAQL